MLLSCANYVLNPALYFTHSHESGINLYIQPLHRNQIISIRLNYSFKSGNFISSHSVDDGDCDLNTVLLIQQGVVMDIINASAS